MTLWSIRSTAGWEDQRSRRRYAEPSLDVFQHLGASSHPREDDTALSRPIALTNELLMGDQLAQIQGQRLQRGPLLVTKCIISLKRPDERADLSQHSHPRSAPQKKPRTTEDSVSVHGEAEPVHYRARLICDNDLPRLSGPALVSCNQHLARRNDRLLSHGVQVRLLATDLVNNRFTRSLCGRSTAFVCFHGICRSTSNLPTWRFLLFGGSSTSLSRERLGRCPR